MLKSSLKILTTSMALCLSAEALAVPVTLGAAADYNGFFLNDVNTGADSQGALAVGGNATLNAYTVNTLGQNSVTSLVVGGDLYQNGGDINGDALVSGTYSSINGGGVHSGVLQQNVANVGIDFAAEFNNLARLSNDLVSQSVTGATQFGGGRVDFFGDGTSGQQVFNLSEGEFGNFWGLYANDIQKGQEVIVNVAGKHVDITARDYLLKDASWMWYENNDSVLFNFFEAETINMSASFEGTLLAVHADITANGGQVNGQLIAKSLTGNVQLNQPLFSHNSTVVAVSEPSSMLLLGAGLVGLILVRRRLC